MFKNSMSKKPILWKNAELDMEIYVQLLPSHPFSRILIKQLVNKTIS